MRLYLLATIAISLLYSCNSAEKEKKSEPVQQPAIEQVEKQSFFPVTSYLKGQLFDFKQNGISPLKYTTIKEHTDSVWLKIPEIDKAVKEFMDPVIDSINLVSLFVEKKFMDQTLNAITFSYDPVGQLPDSMKLDRWDVYVDPPSGKVKRIYMVKNIGDKTLQLTWQSNKWCKINTIINKPDGTSELEKEEKIVWTFDNE